MTAISPAAPSKNVGVLRNLALYLSKYKPLIAGALAAVLVASASILTFGYGLRRIVDEGFVSGDAAQLNTAFAFMMGVIAVLALSAFARLYFVSKLGESVVADMRRDLFSHLIKLPPSFYEKTKVGEILSRLSTDTSLIQTVVATSLPIAVRNAVSLLGAILLLFHASPKLTGMVLLIVPIVVVPLVIFGRRLRILARAAQDRIADASAFADEVFNNIRTVQAYTHENLDSVTFNGKVMEAWQAALKRAFIRALMSTLLITLVFGAIGVVLWIGGYDVLAGRMSAGELASFVFYAIVAAGSTAALSDILGDLQRAAGAAERILELMGTVPAIAAPVDPKSFPENSGQKNSGAALIEFKNVSFSYPSRPQQMALSSTSFEIARGQHIGFAGASGSGKTTIFQLLMRFYDPQNGAILIDGVDIRDVEPQALRARFATVSQDPVIFSGTLLENIRYGRPGASDSEVKNAMDAAMVTQFLPLLPDGINTYLGERGMRLSGGQRQRIEIARAILRNPDILLLDEATSQLDHENERLVQEALEKLMQGRTTLMIAHRLSTLRHCNRIFVLRQGGIAARGTHEELLANNNEYQALAAAKA